MVILVNQAYLVFLVILDSLGLAVNLATLVQLVCLAQAATQVTQESMV